MSEPDARPSGPADAGAADPLEPLSGGESTRASIWPAVYPELLKLVQAHNSTIVFVNNRRSAERVALRLNELAGEQRARAPVEIARAHHGSLAREERTTIEEQLKAGELPCLVATSSLELGIDMGAVDLVLQIESPKSVARGLQRIGRAGHGVGEVSRGRIFPKFRGDLLECAVLARRMHEGLDRADGRAPQRARRVGPADRRDRRRGGRRGRRGCVRSTELHALVTAHALLLGAVDGALGERARHARRSLSVAGVRGAAPADRVGPPRRHDPGPQGRPPARGRQRRHDPRPGAVCGDVAGRAAGRRARRGDGLRGTPRPDIPAGGVDLADRGDRSRPSDRHAGPGSAGRRSVLEGRHGRASRRSSGVAIGAFSRWAVDQRSRGRWSATRTSTSAQPPTCSSTCASSRPPPKLSPATARSCSSASATRSAIGACACSRLMAVASTRPGASRCPRASASELGPGGRRDLIRRRRRAAPPGPRR